MLTTIPATMPAPEAIDPRPFQKDAAVDSWQVQEQFLGSSQRYE
jgi:hypothetical protein